MLFVDDDQAQVLDRGEDGRARSKDDLAFSIDDAAILLIAPTVGEGGIEDGDRILEEGIEAVGHLVRQGDFRNQDQDTFPFLEGLLGEAEIDLRLSRSGHAFKQADLVGIVDDGVVGFLLAFCQGEVF